MGEAQVTLFEPEFNRSIKVQTSDQRITSHAGAILLRELDHQLGLVESLGEQLTDPRNSGKIRYTATELLRERIYALALGSENQDDLGRIPILRRCFPAVFRGKGRAWVRVQLCGSWAAVASASQGDGSVA